MGLDLAGVERIDTAAEARSRARSWSRMARELDTPDAPEQAKDKVRELRARAKAATDWARREEDALAAGSREHDAELERHNNNVHPIRPGSDEQASHRGRARHAARRAGNAAYAKAKPPAMRIVHRGKTHFFQGASEPFGAAGAGWDMFFEALGLTLATVLLIDLLKAPGAITATSSRTLAALQRAVDVADPITGVHAPGYGPPARDASPTKTKTATA